MQIGTRVTRHYYVILTGEYVCSIILMIQCHFQGQKVNLNVKFAIFFKKV